MCKYPVGDGAKRVTTGLLGAAGAAGAGFVGPQGGASLPTPYSMAVGEFNLTLHQLSNDFTTSVHGFAIKTKALAYEIPPAMQATIWFDFHFPVSSDILNTKAKV